MSKIMFFHVKKFFVVLAVYLSFFTQSSFAQPTDFEIEVDKNIIASLDKLHKTQPRKRYFYSFGDLDSGALNKGKAIIDVVFTHNIARIKEQNNPLAWNSELSWEAEKWTNNLENEMCQNMRPAPNFYKQGFGQNYTVLKALDNSTQWSFVDIVNNWLVQSQNYNRESQRCEQGKDCSAFTQAMWYSSTEIGCSIAKCDASGIKTLGLYCFYSPDGNIFGQVPFKKNITRN